MSNRNKKPSQLAFDFIDDIIPPLPPELFDPPLPRHARTRRSRTLLAKRPRRRVSLRPL